MGELNNTWNIQELFPYLSEENQQVIINSKFEEILRSIRTQEDYRAIAVTLKGRARINFQSYYLAEPIKTDADVLTIIERLVGDPEVLKQLLTILKPRVELFNFELSQDLLLRCRKNQMIIIDVLFDRLIQWINPENYKDLTQTLIGTNFSNRYVKHITSDISDFKEFLVILEQWKNNEPIQVLILKCCESQLITWLEDGKCLLKLLECLLSLSRARLFVWFSKLIDNKDLFTSCFSLIPTCHKKMCLSAVTSQSLHCTEEEFEELTFSKSNMSKLIAYLERYISNFPTSAQLKIAQDLLQTLTNNPQIPPTRVRDLVATAQNLIKHTYSLSGTFFYSEVRDNQLYKILIIMMKLMNLFKQTGPPY